MHIELILDAGATIGESPTWVPQENALYWIDVKKPALYRLAADTRHTRCWPLPSDIGAFALLESQDGAVVALRHGVFHLEFSSGALTLLSPPPFDPNLFRFNEGACDSAGRFWIGAMFDPVVPTNTRAKTSLHSFTFASGLRPEPDAAELYNGMAWSPEETAFFLSHSQKQEIYRFDYDVQKGKISERKLFARVRAEDGVPDGAAVDIEGGYWCALHGAAKIRRYTANGAVDREIDLPVSQPTMCAFGGAKLKDLFITSAADSLSVQQKRQEPLCGGLFRVRTLVRGAERHCFVR
ncbi:SMP-30/gluconolactonase/LRE family protein [Robbsia sp. KACC 23696]|uniref:SMP-30/gluconolactonase/LRE family protein n=1 Tax=Robbsia sp. KACC 23696 TaxID=3149231 RepID=UPI00325B83E5